jgi:hypothetical protein
LKTEKLVLEIARVNILEEKKKLEEERLVLVKKKV